MNSMIVKLIVSLPLIFTAYLNSNAQCDSQAGTMGTTPIDGCANEPITALHSGDAVLDANDVLQFVMHTEPGTSLGNVLATANQPVFNFIQGVMANNTTYFISAIVGNDDGSGNVDFTDPCLSVAAGTPIEWHALPTIALVPNGVINSCDGIPTLVNMMLTGEGPWIVEYSINGTPQSPLAVTSNPFTFPIQSFGLTQFCLTSVTDANGCTTLASNQCVTIINSPPITCNVIVEDFPCFGGNNGSVTILCSGGTPPYLYNWGGPPDGPTWGNLAAGTYTVVITDAAGCNTVQSFTINEPLPMAASISVSGGGNCENATMLASVVGGLPPYSIQWFDQNNNVIGTVFSQVANSSGNYSIIVSDGNDCTATASTFVTASALPCGSIIGKLTNEEDGNCQFDNGEGMLANWLVKATATNGDEYFGISDTNGQYDFQAIPGDYEVQAIPPANFWDDCMGIINLTLEDETDVDTADFHQFQVINCPLMEVDISTPFLRRCFQNTYYVSYCNNGSETAVGAEIVVTLDPLIEFLDSPFPHTVLANGVSFNIGDVAPGECGNLHFFTQVSCNATLGQTLCAEAHIYPDSICGPVGPNWSGAFIEVTSECTTNEVNFTLTNTGGGDMDEPSNFIVVEDGVMLMSQEFQLAADESATYPYPANGSTYALLAQQVTGSPGFSAPSIFVEGCGTNGSGSFSTGFALQFAENDADPFLSTDCQEVIGSFDPNDKRGYPYGFGPDNLIEAGQMLDYHIRFQNTGTDTAFKVVIQDVISPNLDIATLRPGTASHPYQLEIHQDTFLFIFENILLPDSNVNEPASHGFVKFRIGQRTGLEIGTEIENEAAIFFDFNDPVITNKTRHQIGEPFIVSGVNAPILPKAVECLVFPNPFAEEAVIVVKGAETETLELCLYDLTGRHLRSEKITGGTGKIKKHGLTNGLYFYEIRKNFIKIGQGKIAIK